MAKTTDKLRHDISRGRAGDKVDWPDPAAAPLGTDDEAAGHSATPSQIAEAHKEEVLKAPVKSENKRDNGVLLYGAVISLLMGSVAVGLWLF